MLTLRKLMFVICIVSAYAAPPGIREAEQNTTLQTGLFEKCIEELGCFTNGPPFYHPVYRPVALLPFNNFDTKFWLFDKNNSSRRKALEPDITSFQQSSFDPSLETKFIIHGYTSSLEEGDWKYRMKDALLNFDQFNVIMVDWTDTNGPPYPQAFANARVVGAQLAQLLEFLQLEADMDAESVHLIGHSLGSHVAGWAGERVGGLGRITGLDPAGPYFQQAEDIVRLDPSDAVFVDIIHTNGGNNFLDGLGILDPIGHFDFYPNGGMRQPGCSSRPENNESSMTENGTLPLGSSNSCNHARAPELFIASIENDGRRCRFQAMDCESRAACETKLQNGQHVRLVEMGFRAQKVSSLPPGQKFYLQTTDRPPYCIQSGL